MPSDITGTTSLTSPPPRSICDKDPLHRHPAGGRNQPHAPPKTQAALLEAMEERQVTIDGDATALANLLPAGNGKSYRV